MSSNESAVSPPAAVAESGLALHIGNKNYSSWSLRPWLLMRQLDIPFVEHLHPFEPDSDWTEFRALCPSGKVPCLVAGDLVVWDSLAIVETLYEQYLTVWPASPAARAWARSATAEMHSGFGTLRSVCSMSCGVRIRVDEIGPLLQRDLDRIAALFADGLRRFGGPFLAGPSFTAVDAFYAPVALRVQTYALPLPAPAREYVDRLLALPHVQSWYDAALAEPWREHDHDAACIAHGTLLADLRGP